MYRLSTKTVGLPINIETLRSLAAARGRADRGTYWVAMLHSYIGTHIMTSAMRLSEGPNPLLGLTSLLVVWVWISATTRRMRDFNAPPLWGWSVLAAIFLLVSTMVDDHFLASLVLTLPCLGIGIVPGDPGHNRYGQPPVWPPKTRSTLFRTTPTSGEMAAH